ncbi:hypothetical protein QLL71_000943 [Salmonella enterica]|uniref:Uncharacterized protein n=1 Tax=Salmonella enterica TaxID=28901 RepID=A0A754E946_SALER|nr:hypothetical protein [Salmonella enterica]EBX1219667.1 hypothetical protein [Salmonella enterica subsp. enterica serovar Newport]ECI3933218.1 hypothetical protein [Salmonella enterica subsp. enterica]ECU9160280.1 hypothetical protein [Salmonella enterica subsp. enterica serovar Newport str. CFSAN000599]EDU1192125.1 hypothetical protein [Salmonella enterica subsp. enterica serovar Heidelberg str. CFSAN000576]EBB5685374.1 hypothetical protein [Salmonella enterica]
MSFLESFGKALIILLEAFLGKRKGQEEAHNNFLDEYAKENCNHRLVEYWFCQFTGWRYAKYRDICFIMASSDPSKILYMAKGINYIARTVEFIDNGECKLSDRYNETKKYTFLFIFISFLIIFFILIAWMISSVMSLVTHHHDVTLMAINISSIIACAIFIMYFAFFIHAITMEFFAFEKAEHFVKSYNAERTSSGH